MKTKTREWFEASGHYEAIQETMGSIVPMIKFALKDLPSEFWETLERKLKDGEISERVGEIYESHFSDEEIERLAQLYTDPVMKKFLSSREMIDKEIHKSTEEFARKILQDTTKLS